MIHFTASLRLDDEKVAEAVLGSTAIENEGYLSMERDGSELHISFESRDYGSFLHTFNDLMVAILLVVKAAGDGDPRAQ
jgi:hypothetical protein